MITKAVFHIDWDKEECLVMALNNIKNLLKAVPQEETFVCVLANGSAAKLFQRERAFNYHADIQGLAKQGIRFLVCSNSLKNFEISKEDLVDACETVEAGIVELIRFQAEGYAYIKP